MVFEKVILPKWMFPIFRTWETLPSLPSVRTNHGCGLSFYANSNYLVVFGGKSANSIPFDTLIMFLNLNDKSQGWSTLDTFNIDVPQPVIVSSYVRRLTPTECDMMYVTTNSINVCRNNFNWTSTPLLVGGNANKKYAAVGVNALKPCAKWTNWRKNFIFYLIWFEV